MARGRQGFGVRREEAEEEGARDVFEERARDGAAEGLGGRRHGAGKIAAGEGGVDWKVGVVRMGMLGNE